jgi:hypothetical protein
MTIDENAPQAAAAPVEYDDKIEARECGNTYQVFIGPNAVGTFTRHRDEDGTPYFATWLGAVSKPRKYATQAEALAAVVSYSRTGR